MYTVQLWELACLRRRPDSRPISRRCTPIHCGSEPARDDGLTADQSLAGVHIHFCGNGHLGFRLTATHFFYKRPKVTKTLRPKRTAPRLGSAYPCSGVLQGTSPTVCFATTSSRCVRLRRTALRAHPLLNTSTRPSEGAGGSRSTARRPTGRPEWLGRANSLWAAATESNQVIKRSSDQAISVASRSNAHGAIKRCGVWQVLRLNTKLRHFSANCWRLCTMSSCIWASSTSRQCSIC